MLYLQRRLLTIRAKPTGNEDNAGQVLHCLTCSVQITAQGMSGKRSYHTPRDPAGRRTMPQAEPMLTANALRRVVGSPPSRKGACAAHAGSREAAGARPRAPLGASPRVGRL